MRIAYCTNVRLPSERAHGHQVAHVCKALHELGHSVSVFAPYRKNIVREDFWTYYSLPRAITVTYLGKFDPICSPWLPGILGLWWMNATCRRELRTKLQVSDYDLLYTRSFALLPALLQSHMKTILELHALPRFFRRSFVRTCNQCVRVVCLTSPMAAELRRWGVDEKKIVVEGDAVDLRAFTNLPDKEKAREIFKIQGTDPVIVYAGQLSSMGLSKGVPELLGACDILATRGRTCTTIIAGGPSAEIPHLQSLFPQISKSVRFLGPILHREIPTLLSAADVLVYPAPASDHPFYHRDTSPLKLFEYMAARRPVVAADLAPLHDVVDDTMVTFVSSGDSLSLADGIIFTIDHICESSEKVARAFSRMKTCTWEERMRRILKPFSDNSLLR